MQFIRHVVVFDAADIEAESAFWAGMLGGQVIADETFHCVVDAAGDWRIGVQFSPNHVRPVWPDGEQQQQVHLDLHAEDFDASHELAMALGATILQPVGDRSAAEGYQVYADPAGHPFCIGWGHPDDARLKAFLASLD